MEYKRMSTKDMLQYCDEALAWEEFGPVDIFFFQSVKRILLGYCSAVEIQEPEEPDVLAEVSQPVTAEELMTYDDNAEGLTSCIAGDSFFQEGVEYVIADNTGKDGN